MIGATSNTPAFKSATIQVYKLGEEGEKLLKNTTIKDDFKEFMLMRSLDYLSTKHRPKPPLNPKETKSVKELLKLTSGLNVKLGKEKKTEVKKTSPISYVISDYTSKTSPLFNESNCPDLPYESGIKIIVTDSDKYKT